MSKDKRGKNDINYIEEQETTTLADDAATMGDIKINHSVVGNIVRLAALEVDGVVSVGRGLVDGIKEIFKGNDSDHGVRVSEDEVGQYNIEVKVQMCFGVVLTKVAMEVQQNVSLQVKKMTMKEVGRVDVLIEGIRLDESRKSGKPEWQDAI
jgi:uncharacterized alkaline shock family protein YloU